MKTIAIFVLVTTTLCSLAAQNDIASAAGVPPHYSSYEPLDNPSKETAVSVYDKTVDDMAIIHFGRGLRAPISLQVLTPTTEVLVNREIPAGQTNVRIDLAGFPDGTYTVRIQMGDKSWVKQIVKS